MCWNTHLMCPGRLGQCQLEPPGPSADIVAWLFIHLTTVRADYTAIGRLKNHMDMLY